MTDSKEIQAVKRNQLWMCGLGALAAGHVWLMTVADSWAAPFLALITGVIVTLWLTRFLCLAMAIMTLILSELVKDLEKKL